MPARTLVVNAHPGPNPQFVDELTRVLSAHGAEVTVAEGGAAGERAAGDCERVIVPGVPLDAGYSLAEPAVQERVERELGWLRGCGRAVLGICWGHEVLGQLYGGRVAAAAQTVNDPRFPLAVAAGDCPWFEGLEALEVFAEHRDYLAEVPGSFRVLASAGNVPYIIWNPAARACGVQFVPEFSGERGRALLARFVA